MTDPTELHSNEVLRMGQRVEDMSMAAELRRAQAQARAAMAPALRTMGKAVKRGTPQPPAGASMVRATKLAPLDVRVTGKRRPVA
jgi:hypothetical protein